MRKTEFFVALVVLQKLMSLRKLNKKYFLLAIFSLSSIGTSEAELRITPNASRTGKIAFTYIKKDKDSDLYLLDLSTQKLTALYTSKALDEYPVWSPDGKQIAFYSDISGDREIYVMNSDGSAVTQLTHSKGIDEDPDWSPDGKEIVFRSEREKGKSNLYLMKSDGSNVRQLTFDRFTYSVPRWSPDKRSLLYSSNEDRPGWDIMIYDFATKQKKQLTKGFKTFCHASWSNDGSRYALSHGSGNSIDIWTGKLGEEAKRTIAHDGRDYDVVWAENDTKLYFVSESSPGKEDYQLFEFDLKTKKETQLTTGDGAVRDPSWTSHR